MFAHLAGRGARTLRLASQLTTFVGKKLLLDAHEARSRTAVLSAAVDHDGMAEDHVPRLACQFDHPEGTSSTMVSPSMKAAVRSAGDGVFPGWRAPYLRA